MALLVIHLPVNVTKRHEGGSHMSGQKEHTDSNIYDTN